MCLPFQSHRWIAHGPVPRQLKHWFTVGPLLPPDNGIAGGNAKEHTMAGFGDEVTVFLDEMAVNYGDRSVLYIR